MIKAWVGREEPRPIPWTPLRKPLGECTVALVITAGIALRSVLPWGMTRYEGAPTTGPGVAAEGVEAAVLVPA